jgi:hypothetical protein
MTNIIRLVPTETGYEVEYRWTTYRFMTSEGVVVDVRGVQDDSNLRGAVVKLLGLDEKRPIAGVAYLPEPTQERSQPVKKAAAAKKAAPGAKKAAPKP